MDPNVYLTTMREIAALVRKGEIDGEAHYDHNDVEKLVECFLSLDEWLSKNGCLPEDWASDDFK